MSHTPAPWIDDRSQSLRDAAEAIARQFPRGYTDEMIAANLRLILAAPDLLAALRHIVAYFDFDGNESPLSKSLTAKAKAALAKAEA